MRSDINIPKQKRLKLSAVILIIFAPFLKKYFENSPKRYPVVGRSSEIDLEKYQMKVLGRNVIDYDKVKRDEPDLYKRIVDQEREFDRNDDLGI
jgi:hypothetical protein